VELAEGIHYIGGKRGGWVRAFLIEDGPDLTLIDTLYDEDPGMVLAGIRSLGRSPSDLKQIVLTHAHRAHLGGLAALKRLSGAKVYSHEWEADIIAGNRKAQPVSIIPRDPLRVYIPWQLGSALGLGAHPPCPVDEALGEGDKIGPLQVLHTPGHTPGHLAFHSPEKKVLISGDSISTWPKFDRGWRSFTLNEKQHRASMRRMAELEPERVGVGHGNPIPQNAAERLYSLVEN
jgi:glyoxylase-like metal-dependent hydrolase (beta-lactamase superfamily II)